jgi:hypothetical protein
MYSLFPEKDLTSTFAVLGMLLHTTSSNDDKMVSMASCDLVHTRYSNNYAWTSFVNLLLALQCLMIYKP